MAKCPKCGWEISESSKTWKYGRFLVRMYQCESCSNRFREYLHEGKVKFILSEHNGSLRFMRKKGSK